ncbi:hypothetical protein BJ741DRAFT_631281, partial [Chytriomyces cf. hyalinus JEL632]
VGSFEKVLACAPVVGNLDGCRLEFFDCESAESEDKVTFDEAVFGTSRLGFDVSDGARLIAESALLMTLFDDEAVRSVCFALIWPSASFGAVEFEMEDRVESVGFVFSEFEEVRFNDKDGFAIAPDFNDPPDKDVRVIPDDGIFPSVFVVAETGRFTDSDDKLESVGVIGFAVSVAETSEASVDFSEASVKFSSKLLTALSTLPPDLDNAWRTASTEYPDPTTACTLRMSAAETVSFDPFIGATYATTFSSSWSSISSS